MESFIFNMLQEKGREAGIDIFEIEEYRDSLYFKIRYHDGEIDFKTHKLVVKEFEAKSTDSLDDVIERIRFKKLNKNYPELKEKLEEKNIIIRDYVVIGDYIELTYYNTNDVKGIKVQISPNSIPSNEEIIEKIQDVEEKQVDENMIKELLENPRVEKLSIGYKRVGEVGIANIEAELKGDELKCHYKREVHKKLSQRI